MNICLARHGIETQRTFAFIKNDITSGRNPLLPGQSIVLVAHSGGGAVVTDLAGMIERDLNVDVRGVVTEGSPLASYAEASRYAEYIVEVQHEKDWVHHIGTPVGMARKGVYGTGCRHGQHRNKQPSIRGMVETASSTLMAPT